MSYSPKRITLGNINDVVKLNSVDLFECGKITFEQDPLQRTRLSVKCSFHTDDVPFYNKDALTRDVFLARVDDYLSSKQLFVADITTFQEGGYFWTYKLQGTLYGQNHCGKESSSRHS